MIFLLLFSLSSFVFGVIAIIIVAIIIKLIYKPIQKQHINRKVAVKDKVAIKENLINYNPSSKVSCLDKLTTAFFIKKAFDERVEFCMNGGILSNYLDNKPTLNERDTRYQDSLVDVEKIKATALDMDVMIKGTSLDKFDFVSCIDNPYYKDYDTLETSGETFLFKKRLFDHYYLPMYIDSINVNVEFYSLAKSLRQKIEAVDLYTRIIEEGKKDKKRREPIPQDVQDKVWNRDGGRCVKCESNERLEFDHIIPFSKGGTNTYRNVQILCEKCNRSKSNNIG